MWEKRTHGPEDVLHFSLLFPGLFKKDFRALLEKTVMLSKIEGRRKRGWQDEMVAWHHRLNWQEFEQTPGDSEGQRSLVCFSSWGRQESDTTEWLNNTLLYKGLEWILLSVLGGPRTNFLQIPRGNFIAILFSQVAPLAGCEYSIHILTETWYWQTF